MYNVKRSLNSALAAFCLLLVLALPTLASTTYTVNFTVSSGNAPTAGSFTYDGSTFSAFDVTWEGDTFDLTTSANSMFLQGNTGCDSRGSTPGYGFILMN